MTQGLKEQLLDFLYKAEGLKILLRHSWLSSGRRESVAEHTWRMCLMALVISPYLSKIVNLQKVFKMILVHDLGEVYSKDHWAWKGQPTNKLEQERKGFKRLAAALPQDQKKELLGLWEEYEANKTKEAKFAKSLDKMEVLIQHIQSNIKTQGKKELRFNIDHGNQYCDYDKFVKSFRDLIRKENIKYYKRNKVRKEIYS